MALPKLSLEELRSEGYLQEVNRRFFHPLGLALTVYGDELYIQDDRDDPEGWFFADSDLKDHADNIDRLWDERVRARKEALGYVVQPAE